MKTVGEIFKRLDVGTLSWGEGDLPEYSLFREFQTEMNLSVICVYFNLAVELYTWFKKIVLFNAK